MLPFWRNKVHNILAVSFLKLPLHSVMLGLGHGFNAQFIFGRGLGTQDLGIRIQGMALFNLVLAPP